MKAVFVVLSLAILITASASAQVAVYRLSFSSSGDNVNYRAFENGYYVTPVGGGTGTLILLQTGVGKEKQFFTYANFGETFQANNGKTKKMVLSAVSSGTSSATTFYAIGDVNFPINLKTNLSTPAVSTGPTTGVNYIAPATTTTTTTAANTSAAATTATAATSTSAPTTAQIAGAASAPVYTSPSVAKTMRGYEISADSQSDLVFSGNSTTQGVAGVSILSVSLQEDMTNYALTQNYSLAGEVTYIQNLLQNQGYTDGRTTTATAAPAATTGSTATTAK
jgi:hypothetical protein